MKQALEAVAVAGIGPVLADRSEPGDGRPHYYVELLLRDGTVQRREFPKRGVEVDRVAKNEATRLRNNLAHNLRRRPGGVALLHDAASFRAIVDLLRSLDSTSFNGAATARHA